MNDSWKRQAETGPERLSGARRQDAMMTAMIQCGLIIAAKTKPGYKRTVGSKNFISFMQRREAKVSGRAVSESVRMCSLLTVIVNDILMATPP